MIHKLRTRVAALFLVVGIVGILGSLLATTRVFVDDKHTYVMELNSIAAPNVAASVGRHLGYLAGQLQSIRDLSRFPLRRIEGLRRVELWRGDRRVSAVGDGSEATPEVARQVSRALDKNAGAPVLFPSSQGALGGIRLGDAATEDALVWLDWAFFAADFDPARALSVALVSEEGVQHSPTGGERIPPELLAPLAADLLRNAGQLVLAREIAPKPQAGSRVLAALAPIPGVRGTLVLAHVPATEASVLAKQALRGSLPLVIAVGVFSLLLGFAFSRWISQPIEELTAATTRIAGGDWSVPLAQGMRRQDELGRLAHAFRRMGRELASREKALQQAADDLRRSEKLATLGQFSAGVAHEVKNPLNVILGYAQLLQMKGGSALSDESKKYLGFIMDETRRASRIITELLTFARQKPPVLERLPARALVDRAMELITSQAAAAGAELRAEVAVPESGLDVEVDRDQIYQVILNLVTNSLQAMEEQSASERKRTVTLRLKPARDPGFAAIEVEDSGPGIPPENLAKLFEPFFSTKGVGKGTGLGLSLCHGIVEQHRGRIEVESTVGTGTTFRVLLPRSGTA